jgi:DNA-directed RNA polymerase sigma subunit (sigma70/sigma32)
MKELSKREFEVWQLKNVGAKTFAEIGEEFGFSRQRAHQLYKRACAKLKRMEENGETVITF